MKLSDCPSLSDLFMKLELYLPNWYVLERNSAKRELENLLTDFSYIAKDLDNAEKVIEKLTKENKELKGIKQ